MRFSFFFCFSSFIRLFDRFLNWMHVYMNIHALTKHSDISTFIIHTTYDRTKTFFFGYFIRIHSLRNVARTTTKYENYFHPSIHLSCSLFLLKSNSVCFVPYSALVAATCYKWHTCATFFIHHSECLWTRVVRACSDANPSEAYRLFSFCFFFKLCK